MIKKIELDFHGRPLSIEVGRLAKQADGAALVRDTDFHCDPVVDLDAADACLGSGRRARVFRVSRNQHVDHTCARHSAAGWPAANA